MESGFGDYNLIICGQNMLFNCFQIQDGAQNEEQNGRQNT